MCLFERWISRDLGMSDPRLSLSWWCIFRHSETVPLYWVFSMPSHLLCRGVPCPRALLPLVFVAAWGCSDGTDRTWVLIFILIDIPAVIRDAELLVLWWRFGSLFFSQNGVRKIYLWHLASWKLVAFGIYFCNSCPRTCPEDSWHYQTPTLEK